jgi:hypothetical protein
MNQGIKGSGYPCAEYKNQVISKIYGQQTRLIRFQGLYAHIFSCHCHLGCGLFLCRIIGAILTRLLSPAVATCDSWGRRNTGNQCPIQLVGRLTFCVLPCHAHSLIHLSDVLNLLVMTGGISITPIYGPEDGGLFFLCSHIRMWPVSMDSPHPGL